MNQAVLCSHMGETRWRWLYNMRGGQPHQCCITCSCRSSLIPKCMQALHKVMHMPHYVLAHGAWELLLLGLTGTLSGPQSVLVAGFRPRIGQNITRLRPYKGS
ncbi:hypothetical protein CCHR01_07072 [Colletotrichum chrysophilum]|uniref:Uncharacterized protein n=1 Tax=Colletotrichum chrysophilum TaxID=1836956 RepID=A0AAD9AKP1_9PEZI|nr:hypothetical protein CCHR01_07072 [Colletotrichum chrysophilum]